MAGAKETPRQKLISLMYLVFITMLALNVSKEVLDGFGQMFVKISDANVRISESNALLYENIEVNASEKGGKWVGHDRTAKKIKEESDKFFNKIESIKGTITEKQKIKDPELKEYSQMDKGESLDVIWFKEGSDAAASEFIDLLQNYKMQVIQVFGSQYPIYIEMVEDRFFTGDMNNNIKNKDNLDEPWLDYNYKGFPLVSSLAKLTMMQNDIRQTEHDVLTTLMGKELKMSSTVNESNYTSLLITEKGAYYQGETFDGSVILGRKGGAQNPNSVDLKIDGIPLSDSDYELIPGGIKLKVNAGSPGDHTIEGNLVFLSEGNESKISVNQTYSVISKPNSAVISADKMNVVYRGVQNPITISIPGIQDSKINASAPGLKRIKGSKYNLFPGKGREVKINVSGTLPDGNKVSSVSSFRIKDIPKPTGYFRGQSGSFTIPKSSLERGNVEAKLEDFDFDLPLKVKSFRFRAPGQPSSVIQGDKLDSKAIKALSRIKNGQTVIISDIEVIIPSNPSYKLKQTSPISITIN
ncbi:gliding motility protein GldM [Flavobacteriaceae bacterium]|jgi:gliding motility-associated protein GldM|nr:gliding motility protein GldM [Flavobacteriaceae bacterium]MDB4129239.1 gliding motility protein GldM [Flavobacteriaceae bacterium]MDC0103758.1 gliding motility protein GldM [Flavobacteriaceae bacterium]MDC1518673.1 gliding motility protein GldM [Flavobacteriaceae bacterium]MDC3367897.1 gliding motility protein GldM [Flavobacteriaceae bacterium]